MELKFNPIIINILRSDMNKIDRKRLVKEIIEASEENIKLYPTDDKSYCFQYDPPINSSDHHELEIDKTYCIMYKYIIKNEIVDYYYGFINYYHSDSFATPHNHDDCDDDYVQCVMTIYPSINNENIVIRPLIIEGTEYFLQDGDIIIFPVFSMHHVPIWPDSSIRISLAINVRRSNLNNIICRRITLL